jgi:hypothetical protein
MLQPRVQWQAHHRPDDRMVPVMIAITGISVVPGCAMVLLLAEKSAGIGPGLSVAGAGAAGPSSAPACLGVCGAQVCMPD